jgi:hypothetical protein
MEQDVWSRRDALATMIRQVLFSFLMGPRYLMPDIDNFLLFSLAYRRDALSTMMRETCSFIVWLREFHVAEWCHPTAPCHWRHHDVTQLVSHHFHITVPMWQGWLLHMVPCGSQPLVASSCCIYGPISTPKRTPIDLKVYE